MSPEIEIYLNPVPLPIRDNPVSLFSSLLSSLGADRGGFKIESQAEFTRPASCQSHDHDHQPVASCRAKLKHPTTTPVPSQDKYPMPHAPNRAWQLLEQEETRTELGDLILAIYSLLCHHGHRGGAGTRGNCNLDVDQTKKLARCSIGLPQRLPSIY